MTKPQGYIITEPHKVACPVKGCVGTICGWYKNQRCIAPKKYHLSPAFHSNSSAKESSDKVLEELKALKRKYMDEAKKFDNYLLSQRAAGIKEAIELIELHTKVRP
jgi:hypothetical protein